MARPSVRDPKDFWAGAIYLGFGLVALLVSRRYAFGSGADMGPGYVPTILGVILVLLGGSAIARSFLRDGEPIGAIAWRPLALVVGATAAFGLLLPVLGLVVALLALAILSAAASRSFAFDIRASVGLVALIAVCVAVFVVGLGVPLPLLGRWLSRG